MFVGITFKSNQALNPSPKSCVAIVTQSFLLRLLQLRRLGSTLPLRSHDALRCLRHLPLTIQVNFMRLQNLKVRNLEMSHVQMHTVHVYCKMLKDRIYTEMQTRLTTKSVTYCNHVA